MAPLPGPLRLSPSFRFVGRSRELALLRSLLPGSGDEGGRVAVLTGESGSGKSRLIHELAQEAAADGALVLYGACDPALPVPYGPFVAALEHLERVVPPDELRAYLGTGGGELSRLLPDLPLRVGELPPPRPGEPGTERHRLHTAVVDLLASVSRRQPLLVVIENLHCADIPTLRLLCHLARFAGDCRMLLAATFEESASAAEPESAAALVELRRVEGSARLQLPGLSEADVVDFVHAAAGGERGGQLSHLARAMHELTGGNPFLVTEMWRTVADNGALDPTGGVATLDRGLEHLGSPQSVREVVGRRLARLAPTTTEVLEAAAVIGPEFRLDVLRAATELDERSLLVALDEAARTGVIEELAGAGITYRFTHELLRRAVYARLSALRRAELHLTVGTVLDQGLAQGRVSTLADIAHHLGAAGALGDTERAVECNLEAAASALATLAFEQAAEHLRTALAVGITDPAVRARAQLELGDACNAAGRAVDAVEAYTAAADIARELEDYETFARSAIGLEEACWRPGLIEPATLELLEEATAGLGEGDSPLRVGLLAALVRTLAYRGEHERADVVRASATAMARRVGDRQQLAKLLEGSYSARGSMPLEEVLERLAEARDLGDELGDLVIQDSARAWRVIASMALGRLDVAAREVVALLDIAARAKQPFLVTSAEHIAASLALCRGNLDEAETRATRARDSEPVLAGLDTSAIFGLQMFAIRREQGRLSEVAPLIRIITVGDGSPGAWRPGLIALLVELGMHDEARRELAVVRTNGLAPLRPAPWMASLTFLTDAAAALCDEELAALIRPELEPHSGTGVVVGHGVAFLGAADRYLGMLAATLGDWDDAARYFDAALDFNRRLGASTWLAHTAYEYARMLARRG
ncbi:MAG TPA: AAA family ATPase, partial [Gemmatimonadales bacterium]|nr:AAA family ATPase [Gemmatimonadales bacterium]